MIAAQRGDVLPYGPERLHDHLFGLVGVVEHALGDGDQPRAGDVDQLDQRPLVAGDETFPKRRFVRRLEQTGDRLSDRSMRGTPPVGLRFSCMDPARARGRKGVGRSGRGRGASPRDPRASPPSSRPRCSAMWQWSIHAPGLEASISRSTVEPTGMIAVSFQTRFVRRHAVAGHDQHALAVQVDRVLHRVERAWVVEDPELHDRAPLRRASRSPRSPCRSRRPGESSAPGSRSRASSCPASRPPTRPGRSTRCRSS